MKIFAVYANVRLENEPEWLFAFRKKYDKLWDLHVTLKQPCFIDDAAVADVHRTLSQLFHYAETSVGHIRTTFDERVTGGSKSEEQCIMFRTNSVEIVALHNRIVRALSAYRHYAEPQLQAYEENFFPHITIARELNAEQFAHKRNSTRMSPWRLKE